MSSRPVSRNLITPESAVRYARRITRGISIFEDNRKKIYLVFSTSVFPVDWLTTAYNLDGKRYDLGTGDAARTVFMFPYSEMERVLDSLSILKTAEPPRPHIRGQVDAPKPVFQDGDNLYRPLIPA
jgi:hypothetical protein